MSRTVKHRRPSGRRRGVSRVVLATSALLSLGVTATAPAASAQAAFPQQNASAESTPRPGGTGSGTPPAISWHKCADDWDVGSKWKCGTLETPLDHRDPSKGTLKLAVAKLPAADPKKRIGSLIMNPGGPGGSGIEDADSEGWPTYATSEVTKRFDLVTYDPRGVGHSIPPLNCKQQTPLPRVLQEADSGHESPRTEQEMLDQLNDKDSTGANCVKNAGWLVPYMSTVDNVHDLDRLRRAVGDAKLNYLGISYGTTIGAVYANMYPNRVRSLILHGVVDARTQMNNAAAFSLSEAKGGEKTVKAMLKACDRDAKHCAFHGHAEKKFHRLAHHLGAARSSNAASFDTWNRFVDLAYAFKAPSSAGKAAQGLQRLYEKTFPPAKGTAATKNAAPAKNNPPENNNEEDVLETTDCLDLPPLPKQNGPWLKRFKKARAEAPVFGPAEVVTDITCRDWPEKYRAALPRHTGPWDRAKTPILVMNQQSDWSTPLRWARNMTHALGQRGLVVINGFGHGVPTDCSRRWTQNHLLHSAVPTGTARCDDGNTTPFSRKGAARRP
ncbi:alpha/beta fold hydrolase [Streptomyces smyrnaeus]|uniref:alpha/beta fold hydrolase n=1 Tax=Streptomyces smyrnaeus TaxID=1387713 RepID=UPI0033B463DA